MEDGLFYSWLTLEELREFRQEFRDRLRLPDRLVLVPPRNLPARNPMFVGRQSELQDIHRRLNNHSTLGVTQQTAAHGLGGVGKTALAYEYAWRYLNDYPGGVLAVPCDTDRPLWAAIAELALALSLESLDTERPEDTAVRVKTHLEGGPPALLILDNVRGPEQWADPEWSAGLPAGNCRSLITTRSPHLGAVAMLPVERLPRDQGIALLAQYRPDAGEPAHAAIVGDVVDWFDGLAVGLTVVGVYMTLHPDLPWAAYYESLQARDLDAVRATEDDVRTTAGGLPDRYERRVDAVLDETIDVLPAEQRRGLEYAALLPEDHVLRLWLTWLLEHDPELNLPSLPGYESQPARPAIEALVVRHLLHGVRTEPDTLAVHRVLRRRLLERLAAVDNMRSDLLDRIAAMAEARGEASHAAIGDRALRTELTPLLALSQTLRATGRTRGAVSLANWLHAPLFNLGRVSEDGDSLRRFLGPNESLLNRLGPRQTGILLSHYGAVLHRGGDLRGASEYATRAIAMDERYLPMDYRTLAVDYSNYATILEELGQYREALRWMRKAVDIQQKHIPAHDPAHATMYANLSVLLLDIGFRKKSVAYAERALQLTELVVGPDDPRLAAICSNLSTTFAEAGEFETALRCAQRALALLELHLGSEAWDVACVLANMAGVLASLHRAPDAEAAALRAIAVFSEGPQRNEFDMTPAYLALACAQEEMGRGVDARESLGRAIEIFDRRLGHDHPDRIRLYRIQAWFEGRRGNIEAERTLLQRAVELACKHFDENHYVRRQLARRLSSQGTGQP